MPPESFSVSVLRPFDLLHLTFHFQNLRLNTDDPNVPMLERVESLRPALIIVQFPPQHVQEEAFFEVEPAFPGEEEPPNNPDPAVQEIPRHPPVRALMAGSSRLVFRLPDDVTALPYSLTGLLDWSGYELAVNPRALPPEFDDDALAAAQIPVNAPGVDESAIEIPYHLFLSPNRFARWIHSLKPVVRNGRSELWHTRLATFLEEEGIVTESPTDNRTVRAIWATDYDTNPNPNLNDTDGFRTSINPSDRAMLVRESSDFTIVEEQIDDETTIFYEPAAIPVNKLMLTSQGAWMDVQGAWEIDPSLMETANMDIEAWRHITTQGRDQYVCVMYAGFLYPFGHRASLIKITERKIQPRNENDSYYSAYLRQRLYLVVREPVKSYPTAQFAHQGREQPLRSQIRVHTLVTPNLDMPTNIAKKDSLFWVRVGGDDYPFQFSGRDVDGRSISFSGAVIFVRASEVSEAFTVARAAYSNSGDRRICPVPRQEIAYAPKNTDKDGDSVLVTESLTFHTQNSSQPGFEIFDFTPILHRANVHIPAIEQFVGSQKAVAIQLFEGYLQNGLDLANNQATLFAELVDVAGLTIPTDKAGGLSTPNIDVTGLSQHLGPVASSLNDLANGSFDPLSFFGRADAQLLGGLSLSDIITNIFTDDQFPKLLPKLEPPPPAKPEKLVTKLDWKPTVKSAGVFVADDSTTFEIMARLEQKLTGAGDTSFEINGKLTNFKINFLQVIEISFNTLEFLSGTGKKVDVNADIVPIDDGGILFLGPLAFLNELRKYIPSDGFIDPPFLDISPTGVSVGFTQALPPLAVGVFSLQNVNLGAVLNLPFTGEPARFRFNFSERHCPFIVTVGIFGGGGFFALALGLDGIETIEASLEFGGNVSLNLGVASGGVYVMAGIYFKYQAVDQVQLSGYFRAGGSLSVLGLITVSLEFYLELSYIEKNGNAKVWGRASLTVKVEVLFFSKSVSITVERTFSGSAGDPTFSQMLTPGDWRAYARAFA
ncbi:MAG: hypothetical protein DWQ04_17470 [Chloroflexi bacterium]|nr:MAG: hypothetical protein DWQ04_17470 [Chloroflexota bacterium]